MFVIVFFTGNSRMRKVSKLIAPAVTVSVKKLASVQSTTTIIDTAFSPDDEYDNAILPAQLSTIVTENPAQPCTIVPAQPRGIRTIILIVYRIFLNI